MLSILAATVRRNTVGALLRVLGGKECASCAGTGELVIFRDTPDGTYDTVEPCFTCDGKGTV